MIAAKLKMWGTLTVGTALLLSGCSGSTGNGEKANETPSAAEGSGKEVVLTLWGGDDFLKGEESPGQRMVKQYNEKNKGKIRVEAKYMPWAEYHTAIQAAATSNELPDVFVTPQNVDIRTVVANGWALPYDGLVSDNWKKQFAEGSFAEGVNVIDGKTYAWPVTGPTLSTILYYNKDVLKNAGLDPEKPPKTWDELRSMSKTVTDKGKGDVYGLVFAGGESATASGINKIVDGLAAGISKDEIGDGASRFNYKTGTYAFDSRAAIDSYNFLNQLKIDGSILPSSYTMKLAESTVLFGQAKAAFFIEGRARMWIIKRDTPDAHFGLAQVPTQDGGKTSSFYTRAGGTGYLISAKTKHAKEVGQFIENGFAAPLFYEKYLNSGVALTPIESINNNKALYPYPEFNQFVQLHKDLLHERPNYAVRNPQTAQVIVELGALSQPKIKPSYGEILQAALAGAQKDLPGALKAYNEKANKGLDDAINKVKGAGVNVSRNDFVFQNWDPAKDYTTADYSQLK
ncbi:ABC transporter substrate-binding protein [Paenibacillus marchantiophytorum]|uniref:ABC transporter substrate-binding protein n=1 Tax=Paenibacillus marchantiophytorum TaxID=1619310 RepID=A0ABQ1EPA7_9BACL|nr:extracellular solute-binding protein [Paenibacillus marchantiophytorum]GFZ80252.1 ABC transporter substrate-binding protein [Paenibacillus marchantiophytorum]